MSRTLLPKIPYITGQLLWWQPLQWSQTTERGRREAFSNGKKEIIAKLNMLGTVDVSLNEICEIEHGMDLVDGDWLKLFLLSKFSYFYLFTVNHAAYLSTDFQSFYKKDTFATFFLLNSNLWKIRCCKIMDINGIFLFFTCFIVFWKFA